MSDDDPTEHLEGLSTRLLGERFPESDQWNPLAAQKGGARSLFLCIVRFLEFPNGIAAANQRAAAARRSILSDTQMKVERRRDGGYCECFFCADVYFVEPDAFGDGCMRYYVGFLAGREVPDGRPA